MPTKIRLLDEHTINQIAAGEVIDNPSSVVKELVENAIDAAASHIRIEVQGGGHQLIAVTDDGCGMSSDDAILCLERHATSKVAAFADLFTLTTMGFRGEAMASVAAVSHLSILTAVRTEESRPDRLQDATFVSVAGGRITSCTATQAFAGTKIEVQSLFYNVPARRKFRRAAQRDDADIARVVTSLALSHPTIEFELVMNQRRQFVLPARTNARERVCDALGEAVAEQSRQLDLHCHPYHIQGLLGNPECSYPNRLQQYLFVNRRPVTSWPLAYAIKDAYGTAIEDKRHPAFVIELTLPPESVDVNVHPQKREVRFRDEFDLKRKVVDGVSKSLFGAVPMISVPFAPEPVTVALPFVPPPPPPPAAEQMELFRPLSRCVLLGRYEGYLLLTIHWDEALLQKAPQDLVGDGVVVVDAKRACARIAFETLQQPTAQADAQTLLLPLFVEFAAHEVPYVEHMIPYLDNCGFIVREFGKRTFRIEAVPAALQDANAIELLHELVQAHLQTDTVSNPLKALQKMAFAISARWPVSGTMALLDKLLACREPFVCPRGRPTCVLLSQQELNKRFGG